MSIQINKAALNFFLDGNNKFTHHSGNFIKIFPFVTNKSHKDIVLRELKKFRGITGKALRLSLKKELPEGFGRELVLCSLRNAINTSHPNILENILSDICFDDYNISKFNKKALLYQYVQNAPPIINSISEYLSEIFLKDIEISYGLGHEQVLDKLLEKAIPELNERSFVDKNYYYYGFPQITDSFKKDISILLKNDKFFIDNIDNFLKYYLYFYLTQMFFTLTNFRTNTLSLRNCFYSVEWESLSESRDAYRYGMKVIKSQSLELFPHVVCLELLQCIEGLGISKFTYLELKDLLNSLDNNEQQLLANAIDEIYAFYTEHVTDISWNDFELDYRCPDSIDNMVFSSIDKLLNAIRYQFKNSSRNSARAGYGRWLVDYGQVCFGKMRGRLGCTHVLSQDILLLFINICIGRSPEGRLRLSDLWIELEQRGISFDQYSRTEIANFLDRNNMLEKKSDSGDAQYVTLQE